MPGWIEQFGRVVVEGQASGVPVVASSSGALPDVVGEVGLLVPPADPVALRSALIRFLDEPGLWERLRNAGIAGAGRYSWRSVAEAQTALYRVSSSPEPDH
jgi:glycosyltransferase involved in cell wall biosynthesis